jgi:hypothetical protein
MAKRLNKRERLVEAFNAIRYKNGKAVKMKAQQYFDALIDGKKKGLKGHEYTLYAGKIFSTLLIDLHFHHIKDAVFATDDTATSRVFKAEMQRCLRENGTPEEHHLLRQ